ncbi:glycosyltransferase family 4 protein [Paenibacillus allorhizosphaerae]|uniref:D-inositol-3-phosphate glycosyltransferase n=1 Tax=Paenibacillus allorhizosphaerae TaxID=2849866 RepID=A0ABM8VER5_9BACL|nr:glycosyltransferase family 4 protein [Paenibacillus allorhizosphaerae]CAG7632426.1 D-inositol-3-phosphate glycosyltransferase [Paenibacillus allorhizosphaerae]
MRILQIADEFNSAGGLERFIYDFSVQLAKKGHVTTLAALKVNYNDSWGEEPFHAVSIPDDVNQWMTYAEDFKPDLIVWHTIPHTAKIVERLARKYTTIATVHGVMCPSGLRMYRDNEALCMKRGSVSCLVNWYARKCGTNISPVKAIQSLTLHQAMVAALQRCTEVFAVSKAIRQFLVIEGIAASKIRIFDNTLAKFGEWSPLLLPKPRNEIKLLYAGRLVYSKGVQYLIQAVRLLLQKGIQVECSIIGEGWYKPELEQLSAQLELSEHVNFAGWIPGKDIHAWYVNADVLVVPSIYPEPAGLVVPEARTMGKPVVVFDSGGLPEWADFMDGVYVARRADAEHLADTIKSIITEPRHPSANDRRPGITRINLVEAIEEGVRTGA